MATFISLCNWTQQGIENVKDSPKRLDAARDGWAKMGVQLKGFYLTMGEYDFVVITEAPDDETAAKAVIAVAATGNARTKTLRAFTEPEYREILGSM